jgi:hypothetical protein
MNRLNPTPPGQLVGNGTGQISSPDHTSISGREVAGRGFVHTRSATTAATGRRNNELAEQTNSSSVSVTSKRQEPELTASALPRWTRVMPASHPDEGC